MAMNFEIKFYCLSWFVKSRTYAAGFAAAAAGGGAALAAAGGGAAAAAAAGGGDLAILSNCR